MPNKSPPEILMTESLSEWKTIQDTDDEGTTCKMMHSIYFKKEYFSK